MAWERIAKLLEHASSFTAPPTFVSMVANKFLFCVNNFYVQLQHGQSALISESELANIPRNLGLSSSTRFWTEMDVFLLHIGGEI